MPFSQRLPSGIGDDRKDTCDLSYFNSGLGSLVNSSNLFNTDLVGSQSPSQQITYNLYGQGSGSSSLGMSALNLPQTSRTIANQQLSRGFGTGSVTGHVTPTSSGFPSGFPSGLPNILSPQAASPNRGILPLSVRSILSGKTPEIKRSGSSNSSSLSGLGSFGMPPGRPFNAHSMVGNLHSSFGGAGDSNNPPTLDLSEFPSLSARGHGDSVSQPNPMVGRAPYGNIGMVKQPQSETAEFTMSSEDFPALPGSNSSESSMSGDKNLTNLTEGPETFVNSRAPGAEKSYSNKRGIQTASDGKVTNIPSGMVTDQFGMVGLLTFIRVAETDPNLVSLALGQDLTTLGLNLNSPESLYPTFGGPWAEMPCRPQDIDFHVPVEYLININIRDKLAQVKLNRYGEDLLFYLFYTYVGDLLQMYAAAELYNRDWRYHKEERVWITRAPGLPPVEKTNTYERGTYYFFDAQNWRKVAKEFHLDYDKLEEHPTKNQAV